MNSPKEIVEKRIKTIISTKFDDAINFMWREFKTSPAQKTNGGALIADASRIFDDKMKNAIRDCIEHINNEIKQNHRADNPDYWPTIKQLISDRLNAATNSIQATLLSQYRQMPYGSIQRTFTQSNTTCNHLLGTMINDEIEKDQIRSLDPISKPDLGHHSGSMPLKDNSNLDYVALSRIESLRHLSDFDPRRLIRLCEELNSSFKAENYLAVCMLLRAIIDHIPPIFQKKNFDEVASNHGAQSFKNHMQHLAKSLRNIADTSLHIHIRKKETLPTVQQVNFSTYLDSLIEEIIRISCEDK